MELELIRTYHPNGTNGSLLLNGVRQCFTIELPWLENRTQRSCIPEGRYLLERRYSRKFGDHIEVRGVKDRSMILIHPANDALKELRGCIAPVSQLTGAGRGSQSKLAFIWLRMLVYAALEKEPVYLTIKEKAHDSDTKNAVAHTKVL